MITPELLEFLRTQHAEGMSLEEMERLLVTEGGWNKEDVTEAFRQIGILPVPVVKEIPLTPVSAPAEEVSPLEIPAELPAPTPAPLTPPASIVLESAPSVIEATVTAPLRIEPTPSVVFEPTVVVSPSPVVESETDPVAPPVVALSAPVPEVSVTSQEITSPQRVAEKIVELPVSRHVETPEVTPPHVDDFLGLFSAQSSEQVTHSVPSFVQPQEEKSDSTSPQVAPVLPSSTEIPVLTVAQEHIDSLAQNIPATKPDGEEVLPVSPDVTPLVFGKKPEWSFQDLLAQQKEQTPETTPLSESPVSTPEITPPPAPSTPPSSPSTIQFDLSRVNAAPAASEATPKTIVRPIETKSVAELWLSGKKQTEEPVAPYVSATPRSSISPRRTMNSDLLRGKGETIRSMPALSAENLPAPAPLPVTPPPPLPPQSVVKNPVVTSQVPSSLAEDLKRKNKIKRVLGLVLGVLVLMLLVAGALAFLVSHRGPSVSDRLATALSQVAGISSFAYSGDGFVDLALSAPAGGNGVTQNGVVNFMIRYSGHLKNTAEGFGDGTHTVKLSGGLRSGEYAWNTDVESNVHLIGDTLYFHLLSYPAESEFDPEVMNTYWVKVDLGVLAKELALSSGNSVGQGYGSFGSGKADMSFSKLYASNLPFVPDGTLEDETVSGTPTTHVKLKAEKDRMYAFALILYKKYSGKDLVLTESQQLRLKDALGKITGEAWIDPVTGQMLKVKIRGDFDDDMVDAHVKGNAQLIFMFSDQGKEVVVKEPTPILTLEEFRARTEEYKKNKELRVRDTAKQEQMLKIILALSKYQKEKGRFPATLLDLRVGARLPVSEVDDLSLKQFSFASYLKPESLTKIGRCTAKGKVCEFYHLGVNFEDLTNPALNSDADAVSEVNGKDSTGCGAEINFSCYDVVSTSLSDSTESSATTTGTTR